MHTSVKLNTPVEFINITPVNPLISKCEIKVCYVGDEPNRNGSVITKEVAKEMANSLPGSPIVGFYNEDKEDFEEHNRIIDISNGKFEIKDTTRPYGFVDLSARVWFQKFLDDGMTEHEYMMTEGWLWTGQYPECRRILAHGNNQSMELDEETLRANWSEDDNGGPCFFIINEAIISKLCILGEANEPCFEGANIGAPTVQFSFADGFKEKMFSMMNELKEFLDKGGKKVFNKYSVEIGDSLWAALYNRVYENYSIISVCEEEEQKFAVLNSDDKYYRLDFSILEDGTVEFAEEASIIEEYEPDDEPQFDPAAIQAYADSIKKEPEIEICEVCGKPVSECECNLDKSEKYNLNEIQEYVELSNKYSDLEEKYNQAQNTIASMQANLNSLIEFKKGIEKTEKEKMIASFYMLSDEDKKDVIENIDNYSLEDIEAKLSIICVRNKVSFNLEGDNANQNTGITFSLDGGIPADQTPEWIKVLRSVANEMQ